MAGIRPAKCYRWDSPAYTRVSSRPSDSYITGIPGSKVIHFDMGNKKGEFDTKAEIVYVGNIQVRHNSMEAARIIIQKRLEKFVGVANYYFKINAYPHHVMRENVTATGAGADRVSEGMRRAFGKPIGRAARMQRGQTLFTIKFNNNDARRKLIKKALELACNKLPGEKKVSISPIVKKPTNSTVKGGV
ncbi:MAG: 50S ribosomal protein L16 [Candidatus Altiarchaeota archaeon]|nr:50S ribosomal protein L16 [Candidatus Altiarchaeota archaeon]